MKEKGEKVLRMPEDLVPHIQEIVKLDAKLKLGGKLTQVADAFREIVDPAFDYKYTPTSIEEFNRRFSTPVAEASPYQPPAAYIARDKTAYLIDFNYDFTNFDGVFCEVRLRIFSDLTAKIEILEAPEFTPEPKTIYDLKVLFPTEYYTQKAIERIPPKTRELIVKMANPNLTAEEFLALIPKYELNHEQKTGLNTGIVFSVKTDIRNERRIIVSIYDDNSIIISGDQFGY